MLASGYVGVQQSAVSDPFEQLFIAEYSRVVGIAARVLGDVHEAEDVAQEVFLSWRRRHQAPDDRTPGWLYAAAVHTALNVLRGRRRRTQREVVEAQEAGLLHGQFEAAYDPLVAVVSAERRSDVRAALSRLSAKSAAVLILRHSGLSYAEVASALGIRGSTVGSLLKRAESALRKEITNATPE